MITSLIKKFFMSEDTNVEATPEVEVAEVETAVEEAPAVEEEAPAAEPESAPEASPEQVAEVEVGREAGNRETI